jgi:hypothetical protein
MVVGSLNICSALARCWSRKSSSGNVGRTPTPRNTAHSMYQDADWAPLTPVRARTGQPGRGTRHAGQLRMVHTFVGADERRLAMHVPPD